MIITTTAIVLLLALQFSDGIEQQECIPRSYGLNSVVCVCNATYCDTIPRPQRLPRKQYISYTSTQSGLRFKIEEGKFQSKQHNSKYTIINVDPRKRYQAIIGWGGAFTDSTGININSLSHEAADHLMKSYFSEEGLEYNLCRVPIGGTDFSARGYSYNDGNSDPRLLNFQLAPEDYSYKIPLIKQAQNLTNDRLELFASAWTAPLWMKTNNQYHGPGFLKPEMYQSWADYFLKFLKAYKAEGVTFWGITTGNEPGTGLTPRKIPAVGWLPGQMRKWIAENLGPTIRNSEFSSLKIMAIDDQALFYPWLIHLLFENKEVERYIDGFGLHWYLNKYISPELFTITHNRHPTKFILATEACEGSVLFNGEDHVRMGEWNRAMSYANDIINDLNNWVTGWIDWNMALDVTGGPTFIDNNVDSAIIVNATANEFYKQPMYYALGHFSKFIPKGSERVAVTQSSTNVNLLAFQRPDDGTAVVVMNNNTYAVPVKLRNSGRKEIRRVIPAKSITTILYWQ